MNTYEFSMISFENLSLVQIFSQIVALIGGHTLGECDKANSGYRGPWLQDQEKSTFDNKFYQVLANQSIEFFGDVSLFKVTLQIKSIKLPLLNFSEHCQRYRRRF